MGKIGLVIPTHEDFRFIEWLNLWQPLLDKYDVELFVVEDSDTKSNFGVKNHYYRKDFPDFVPSGTGSCRSYGFLKAYQSDCDWIVTLDHDCYPVEDIFQAYIEGFEQEQSLSNYFDVGNSFGLGEYMRGYPFKQRRVTKPLIQYGGWDNVPDMDAITQLKHGDVQGYKFDRKIQALPQGIGFTGCIMNTAMKREVVPLLYQLIMGTDRVGYDRWDDIWSGLFAKKICDHLEVPIIVNGFATIKHSRASNPHENLKKETGGYELNENMWEKINSIQLGGNDILTCYQSLTNQLNPEWFGPQGYKIIEGMQKWLRALQSV